MRIAVIYNDEDIFVEFTSEVFKEMLKNYLAKFKDVDQAFEQIIRELKEKTITK